MITDPLEPAEEARQLLLMQDHMSGIYSIATKELIHPLVMIKLFSTALGALIANSIERDDQERAIHAAAQLAANSVAFCNANPIPTTH